MDFDLKELIHTRLGDNYDLHEQFVNRTLVKVLRTIGFDKVYARAQGAYLYDMDGRDYLDFLSGYGVYNIGRNHPTVKQAIQDVLELDLPNMVQMDCSLLSGLLAEALARHTGPGRDAFFFCNSGAEAVEGALKFARCSTGRSRILALTQAYHGLSYGALSITGNPHFQEGFGPFLPGAESVRFNDLNDLEAKLRQGDVAAFIVEPVQGKGVFLHADNYLVQAQALCRQHGALFICDEVQTGLGRTGRMFGFQHWDLDPDIITIAKTLSGGFAPAAAVCTRRSIYQSVFSRMDRCVVHSSTFGRNNLAMACGLATLHVIEKENLVANAACRGEQLLAAARATLLPKHDWIKEIRGLGLMFAIEFHAPASLKHKIAWKAVHAVDRGLFAQMIVTALMQKHRILTHVAGHNLDVVKAIPPLMIGDTEINRFVNALDEVIGQLGSVTGPLWDFGANLVKAALSQKGSRAETASSRA
jgi:acetylornithine/succinyldiaminopimelate/putrescine aminotransferase